MSDDPTCNVCGERKSAHVATDKGPYTHPREARGEGAYEQTSPGHIQGGGAWFDDEHVGPSYRFVPAVAASHTLVDVVGFEGLFRKEHLVTWGSAAIWDGENVVNMGSGFGSPDPGRESWHEYVKDGVVTAFEKPIPIEKGALSLGAIVLAVRERGLSLAGPSLTAFMAEHSLGAWTQGDYTAVLYRDHETFALDVHDYVKSLCKHFEELVSRALVLGGHGLEMNVLRTALRLLQSTPGEDAFTKAMGRAILRREVDEVAFDRIFGAPSVTKA